jgi:lipid A 3-O-deacylase
MFKGDKEITPDAFRLAYIYPTDYQWHFNDNQKIALELEVGLHHWKDPLLDKSKNGVMVNPMWRYFISHGDHAVFIGLGIGLAYTNDKFWMDRQLGSRWLFEDRLEVGTVIFSKHRISFSLNHYSNANITDINHGANVHYLNYSMSI